MWAIGPPLKLTQAHVDTLVEYLAGSVDYYLEELVAYLGYNYGVWVSESTVSQVIHCKEFSCKVVTHIAAQRD